MRYTAAALVLLGTGSIASAQEVRLAATQAWTNHRLLGDARGVAAGAAVVWIPALALRITVSNLGHDQARTGRTCTGLLPPDPAECPVEPIEDETSVSGVVAGLAVTVARRGNVALALIPSTGVFWARTTSEGRQTGNQLSGTGSMIGFAAGAELSLIPNAAWPVALHAGVHAGTMRPNDDVAVADGYDPFISSIAITRAEIGFSVRIPRRSPR